MASNAYNCNVDTLDHRKAYETEKFIICIEGND